MRSERTSTHTRQWLLAAALILLSLGAQAISTPLPTPDFSTLVDPGGKLGIEEIRRSQRENFQAVAAKQLSYGFTDAAVWTHWRLKNESPEGVVRILEVANPRMQELDLYIYAAGTLLEHRHAGASLPFSVRESDNVSPTFNLQLAAGQELEFFLRSKTETAHFLPLRFHTPESLLSKVAREYVIESLFYGMLLVLLAYNLSLLLLANERTYFNYVLFLASAIFYRATIDGYTYQLLWPDAVWWAHRSGVVLPLLTIITALLFAQRFLSTRETLPRSHLLLNVLVATLSLGLIANFFIDYHLASYIAMVLGVAHPILLVAIGILAWRGGDKASRYLVISFLAVLASVGVWVGHLTGWLPDHWLSANAIDLGVGLEFLLLNLGITDRMNRLRETQLKSLQANMTTAEQMADLHRATQRFVPLPALRMLGKDDLRDIQLGEQIERRMTVLFTDIPDLSGSMERFSVEQNIDFLNQYFSLITAVVEENNGFVGRFIGDAMLCLFPGSADDAVQAALGIANEFKLFNEAYASILPRQLDVSVGVNTGHMRLGTVGEPDRMEIAVLGDGANLAARVQTSSRSYGAPVLITGETQRALQGGERFYTRLIDSLQPRGRLETVTIYEVFNTDLAALREGKVKCRPEFEKAVTDYCSGRTEAGLKAMRKIAEKYPADRVAASFLWRWQIQGSTHEALSA